MPPTTTQPRGPVGALALDGDFNRACADIGLPATKRQASKYLNGYGALYNASRYDGSIGAFLARRDREREAARLAAEKAEAERKAAEEAAAAKKAAEEAGKAVAS